MEDYVFARECITPAKNRVDNSEHLFDLNVLVSIAPGTSRGEPVRAKVAAVG
jgi:hypothetical protein